MTRIRLAAVVLAAIILVDSVAASGCAGMGPGGTVATGTPQPDTSTADSSVSGNPPNANLANSPIVGAVRSSVVKVQGAAQSCKRDEGGTGFLVAPHRVMSTADVIAGAGSVSVEADGVSYGAQVVSYDPNTDISILAVPNLTAPPLAFAQSPADSGADALILGYPQLQTFVATAARIKEIIDLNGPDIYRTSTLTREVYTLNDAEEFGDSGGPLIDLNGHVLGVYFGSAMGDPTTGFALTANEIASQMAKVTSTTPVSTGVCLPHRA